MNYRVVKMPHAQNDIAEFSRYTNNYSTDFATEQFKRLNHILTIELADILLIWSYFYITGVPYRAYLFRVGRRTCFWIIYTVDEEKKVVYVLRFWNARKDPETFLD